jgi:hypothetical protein
VDVQDDESFEGESVEGADVFSDELDDVFDLKD